MRAITTCIQFDDLLAITLPQNARHFEHVLVATTPEDKATQAVVASVENATCFCTDAFYRGGASFRKGLAVEEGLDQLGRDGWIVIFDADIVMPEKMDLSTIERGNLYCPHRRICNDSREYAWSTIRNWNGWPLMDDREHAGYWTLFHADDPVLKQRPWYGTNWKHAGGCDSDFQAKWPAARKIWLPFEVLHLGPTGINWHGRCTPMLDGTVFPEAAARREAHLEMLRQRAQHGTAGEKFP
uniref:Putative glycosyltransferase n=1 Tax=viral metagenome TaxID=1070528 RepID=A0A6M3XFY5_9ZZZZ